MEDDQRRFEQDIKLPSFRQGRAQGKWRIVKKDWPTVIFSISYADGGSMCFSVELDGYPDQAPLGTPWHHAENRAITSDELPVGITKAKNNRLLHVFRVGTEHPIYEAFDRSALDNHPEWAGGNPSIAWNPSRDIAFYMERLHEVLN